MSTQKQRLEEIRKTHRALVASEHALRDARNTAVLNAVAMSAPVTHLAKAAGISRELVHRILRAAQMPRVPNDLLREEAIEKLCSSQRALESVVFSRVQLEKRRAAAIQEAVLSNGSPRGVIADLAGVSVETVRKVFLQTLDPSKEIEHPVIF